MSLLPLVTFSNPTTEIYAKSGGDASGWSNFPATNNVNMDGYYIVNCNDLSLANGQINGVSDIAYSADAQINNSGGIARGTGMADTTNYYVADITTSAPRTATIFTNSNITLDDSGGVGMGQTAYTTFSQTDISQQQFRITFQAQCIIDTSTTSYPFGVSLTLTETTSGASVDSTFFNSKSPYLVSSSNYILTNDGESNVTFSITDTFEFNGAIQTVNGDPLGLAGGSLFLQVLGYPLPAGGALVVKNINYTYQIEPLIKYP